MGRGGWEGEDNQVQEILSILLPRFDSDVTYKICLLSRDKYVEVLQASSYEVIKKALKC